MLTAEFGLYSEQYLELSAMEISYYLKVMCEAYDKIMMLDQMCGTLLSGGKNTAISFARAPAISGLLGKHKGAMDDFSYYEDDKMPPLFKQIQEPQGKRSQFFFGSDEDMQTFFRYFRRARRPELRVNHKQVYNRYGSDAIRLREMRYNSPLFLGLEAALAVFGFLTEELRRDERHREEMAQLEQQREINSQQLLGERFLSIQRMENCAKFLNDPQISESTKALLKHQLDDEKDRFQRTSAQLGIGVKRLDTRG